MSVTSGFFNSKNGDRKYNAEQMSAIFDGIINDGIFANIGNAFVVKVLENNTITVDTGKAWFNSTWLLNDSILPIDMGVSEILVHRIDAVVIEMNHTDAVRSGSITIVKGTPSSSPKRPTMLHTLEVNQYPLAYIYRKADSTKISQADITNMIGTSTTPYITGILEVVDIDHVFAQWESQWDNFYDTHIKEINDAYTAWTKQWNDWYKSQTDDMTATNEFWKEQWRIWFTAQTTAIQNAYLAWTNQWNDWYERQTDDMTATNEFWKNQWSTWFADKTEEIQDAYVAWINQWDDWYERQTDDMTATNEFWKEQWSTWFGDKTDTMEADYSKWSQDWLDWYESQTSEMSTQRVNWENDWQTWFTEYRNNNTQEMVDFKNTNQATFDTWFANLNVTLDGNVATNIANQLLELRSRTEVLEKFTNDLSSEFSVYQNVSDDTGDVITDNLGRSIESSIIFVIK